MQTLLDDYKRKLELVTEMLNSTIKHDVVTSTRLKTKQSEYRSFITDIERMIVRNS